MRMRDLPVWIPVSSMNPLVLKYVARRVLRILLVLLAVFLFDGALPTAPRTPHQASRLDQSDSVCISFSAGWNLVSLPVKVSDGRTIVQFPTAVSSAFSYEGGYIKDDTIRLGMGYWLKFDSSQPICFYDTVVTTDTINVVAGWNLIGSISFPVNVSSIISEPPYLIASPFYGYSQGYFIATTIEPGHGYWVKVTQNGKLIFNSQSVTNSPTQISILQDSILYTFAIPRTTFGIRDTLTATLTLYNESSLTDTLLLRGGGVFCLGSWSLKNDSGRTITSGPAVCPQVLVRVPLDSHQSLGGLVIDQVMADTSGAPIIPGSYVLQEQISSMIFTLDISFQ